MKYRGSCHCADITFEFESNTIEEGVRCNCSICIRKGALMTTFTIKKEAVTINVKNDALNTYQFGSHQAVHYFCKNCGIYTFHQSMVNIGELRFNIGCIESLDTTTLPFEIYDGASI